MRVGKRGRKWVYVVAGIWLMLLPFGVSFEVDPIFVAGALLLLIGVEIG